MTTWQEWVLWEQIGWLHADGSVSRWVSSTVQHNSVDIGHDCGVCHIDSYTKHDCKQDGSADSECRGGNTDEGGILF